MSEWGCCLDSDSMLSFIVLPSAISLYDRDAPQVEHILCQLTRAVFLGRSHWPQPGACPRARWLISAKLETESRNVASVRI